MVTVAVAMKFVTVTIAVTVTVVTTLVISCVATLFPPSSRRISGLASVPPFTMTVVTVTVPATVDCDGDDRGDDDGLDGDSRTLVETPFRSALVRRPRRTTSTHSRVARPFSLIPRLPLVFCRGVPSILSSTRFVETDVDAFSRRVQDFTAIF